MNSIGKKSTCQVCRMQSPSPIPPSINQFQPLTPITEGATWHGGNHSDIPLILEYYPESDWCTCDPKVEVEGKEYPPEGKSADSWGKRYVWVFIF